MKINNQIEMLEIHDQVRGNATTIYPVLVSGHVLIDTGFPGELELFKQAISLENLTHILITHHDIDHIGNALAIKNFVKHPLTIGAHEIEKPFIEGAKTPLKITKLKDNPDLLPIYDMMNRGFLASYVPVNQTLTDLEILPFAGGLQVLFTPGHTLGHICFYHIESKTLIAGDILTVTNGELTSANPSINEDNDLLKQSLIKINQYPIDQIISFHGGFIKGAIREKLNKLIQKL